MPLSNEQLLRLTSAAVLLGRCAAVLSEFEARTIAEVGARFLAFRSEAIITTAEWEVIDAAVDAMRSDLDRRLGRPETRAVA